MKRRSFLFSCAASTALWSTPCVSQARMPKVGILIIDNPEPALTWLRDALRQAGYVEGKSLQIELRAAAGKADVLAQQATDLVRANVDVIVAVNTGAVQAAMQATKTIPIVMAPAGAPLETGLIRSLNRPGANVTGVTSATPQVGAKTLEVAREIMPSLRRLTILVNANDISLGKAMADEVRSAGGPMKIDVHALTIRAEELESAIAQLEKSGAHALMAQPSLPRMRVIDLALKHRIALIVPSAVHAEAGALMSYSGARGETYQKAVTYVVRILKGANPATMAIEQVTRYELAINLKTARALGLMIPPAILARADRVFE